MKRNIIIAAMTLMTATVATAQNTAATFANKDNVLSVGFGFGGVYGFSGYDAQTPVIGAQYERGIVELKMGGVIGVGGFIGYKGYSYKYNLFNQTWKDKYSVAIIGARGNFHYDLFEVDKLDTYAGTMIAYHIINENLDSNNGFEGSHHADAVYVSIYAGGRYYFAPQIAAFAEVGYGTAWLTMGMSFKF